MTVTAGQAAQKFLKSLPALDEDVSLDIDAARAAQPPSEEAVAASRRRDNLEEQQRTLRKWCLKCGVPLTDAMRILGGDMQETVALRAARRLLEHKQYGGILCLAGPNGLGKSFASSWLVMQGPPREYPYGGAWPEELHPRFISVGDLQRISLYGHDEEWNAYRRCSVLAVDDVGTEFKDEKGSFDARFDQLIAAREKGACWTILTTNLPASNVQQKYGLRVIDRLRREGSALIHLRGDSLRQPAERKTTNRDRSARPEEPGQHRP